MADTLDYSRLYRLPFSKNDNFNGWIEITTACNLSCPGCYRGCDRQDHPGRQKSVEEIEQEIRTLQRIRNCSMISISGGEPLLHPDLLRIVAFIKANNMTPVLFTNGVLLDEARLISLRQAGLVGAVIRVDSLQNPQAETTEAGLHDVRARFVERCAKAGVFLVLTTCVDRTNLDQVGDVISWAQARNDGVGQLLFILKRPLMAVDKAPRTAPPALVSGDEFVSVLSRAVPGLAFAAYLGSQAENQKAKWLQAFRFLLNGTCLGYADKGFVELLQSFHHLTTGRYLGMKEKPQNALNLARLLVLACFNRSLRPVLRTFAGHILRRPWTLAARVAVQGITVVVPPYFVDGKRDLCDSCPDAMLVRGELAPSCALAEIERFGHLSEQE
jgi:pyruvate-formate lyase-activating enzyme